MKYLKVLTVVLLSIILASCSSSEDTRDAQKEEKKNVEAVSPEPKVEESSKSETEEEPETEKEEEKISEDVDTNELEATGEYIIGGTHTPILGINSIVFLEEAKDREESKQLASDITEEFPKVSNYAVALDVLIEVKSGGTSSYDVVILNALVDETEPVKIYSESADKETGVYSPSSYEEDNKGYVYDGVTWNEVELPEDTHVVFGLANIITGLLNEHPDTLTVTENASTYFLEYAGEENELTKALSELFNFTYEGANMDTLVYHLIASVDKKTHELTDFIILSKVNGFNPDESLQIEVYGEYEEYGEHQKETIQKPEDL